MPMTRSTISGSRRRYLSRSIGPFGPSKREEQLEGGGDDLKRGAVLEMIAIVLAAKVADDVVVLTARAAVVRQGQYGVARRAPAVELLEGAHRVALDMGVGLDHLRRRQLDAPQV